VSSSHDIHADSAIPTGKAGPAGGAGPADSTPSVFSVLNPAYSGGADRTGSADCSGAFQAALNALAAYGGGTLYVPAGNYQLANGVTWDSSAPLRIAGDGPQASNIRCASTSASITYVSITNTGSLTERGNDGTVIIEDLAFYNDVYAGAFSDTNIGLYLDNVNFGQISNVGIYKGNAPQRINQAIVLNACNQVDIDNCNIFAAVNGVAVTGFSQVNNIRSTSVWTPAGTGCPGSVPDTAHEPGGVPRR
jgi:polygalacturonase